MYGKPRIPIRRVYKTIVFLILVARCSLHSQDWQRVGIDYNATDIAHDGRIIFVGDFGGVLLSEDDGATWSLPRSGTWSRLRAVRFRDALTGVAAGDGGTLVRTTDGGRTWGPLVSPVSSSIHALDFPVATVGYGLADSGVMIRTSDGGETWDTLRNRLPGTGTGMRFINEERGIVVTEEGVIYRTESSGVLWQPVFTDSSLTFSGVAFNASGITGYACTLERVILKTTDAGKTWRTVETLEPGLVPRCVAVAETGGVYVGGQRVRSENPDPFNAVAWSDDGGATWKRPSLLITGFDDLALEAVAIRGGRLAFAGNNGTALIAGPGMEREVQHTVSNSLLAGRPGEYGLPVYRVAFSGPDTGIATVNFNLSASNTVFLRTTDGGISWRYGTSPNIQNYLDIFGFPGGEFLAFSDNGGGLDRTTNVGKTWLWQDIEPTVPKIKTFRAGTFVDRRRGYKSGDSLVYQTTDSGKTWQPRFFTGLSGRWSAYSLVTDISFPTFDSGYAVFVTGEGDKVSIVGTNDAGETWREVASRKGRDDSTGFHLLYSLHFVNGDHGFYCEANPRENAGILFSTTDGGESWDSLLIEDALPYAVKFFDERNGFVLGSPFFVLRTSDGGETWNREYPWPPEADTSRSTPFLDAVLLPDERTVVLIGYGVIARKTYPDKLVSVAERAWEEPAGTFRVTPNPAHDRLRVVTNVVTEEGTAIRLYDLLGRDVLGGSFPLNESGRAELDVSGLSAGTYRAVIVGEGGRLIVSRSVMIIR